MIAGRLKSGCTRCSVAVKKRFHRTVAWTVEKRIVNLPAKASGCRAVPPIAARLASGSSMSAETQQHGV